MRRSTGPSKTIDDGTPPPRTLALWGDRGSGKSGIIGALRSEASKSVGERWAIDLADLHAVDAEYAESASLALRLRDVKDTPIRRPDRPATFAARRFAGSREQESVQLSVLDPRGVLAARALGAESTDVMHAVATADGIIWLIETRPPEGGSHGQPHLLEQVLGMLEASRTAQVATPVAIVLSKIDRLPAASMRHAMNAPEEALRAQLGDAAFGWLLAACPRVRCFALSAAGTVRNAARPMGLSAVLDWFGAEWRRGEREAEVARSRERRSARVARVRRRVPVTALAVTAAAIVVFAGGAVGRRILQRSLTWSTAAGGIAARDDPSPAIPAGVVANPASAPAVAPIAAPRNAASLATAVTAYERGDAREALRLLESLSLPAGDTSWFASDSVLAVVALRGADDALHATPVDTASLRLVVATTSAAIDRAPPGSYVLATLSVARAEACIAGRLECPADRLREDLVWALLLGTPPEQEAARRLRAAWLADTIPAGS